MTENITKIFKGYFSSKETIKRFLECLPNPQSKKIKIADFGGGSGYLLEKVERFYQNKNYETDCWLIDQDNKQLQSAPKRFRKIQESCLTFYKENYFDLIIMRSMLQFVLKTKDKIKVLDNIYISLNKNGIFINQALFFEKPDNFIVQKSYQYFNRLLKIETLNELINIYNQSKFGNCKISNFCPIMSVNNTNIKERFHVNNTVIKKMTDLFEKHAKSTNSIEMDKIATKFQINCNYVIVKSKK